MRTRSSREQIFRRVQVAGTPEISAQRASYAVAFFARAEKSLTPARIACKTPRRNEEHTELDCRPARSVVVHVAPPPPRCARPAPLRAGHPQGPPGRGFGPWSTWTTTPRHRRLDSRVEDEEIIVCNRLSRVVHLSRPEICPNDPSHRCFRRLVACCLHFGLPGGRWPPPSAGNPAQRRRHASLCQLHGLMTATPAASKGAVSRDATAKPRDAAMAAM